MRNEARRNKAENVMERRSGPRVREENGIAVRVGAPGVLDTHDDSGTVLRLTKDISQGGLQFSHAGELAPGTEVTIHMALHMPRKIVTHVAGVRWAKRLAEHEPYSIGVAFTNTSPIDMAIWSDYVTERIARESGRG